MFVVRFSNTWPGHWRLLWPLALLVLLGGCTDPYLPEAQQNPPSYLVVDGFLNAQGTTSVKLARTYGVNAKSAPPVEAKAAVYLEEEGGARTPLPEGAPGTYAAAAPRTLSPARRYRLHLFTLAGQEYASDWATPQATPPIDALRARPDAEGLHVEVSAHDATGNTRYYRWSYVETWEINPIYRPQVEYKPNLLLLPDISVPYPTRCWGTAYATTVLLANTTPLAQDVVSARELRRLAPSADQLNSRYSILVQQHAISKAEYDYWELLRKNTESIGSLFDPQPVQLTGNVRCLTTPAEPVLGYVSAHTLAEQRLFVERRDLPRNWNPKNGYEDCYPPDTLWLYKNPPKKYPIIDIQSHYGPTGSSIVIDRQLNSIGAVIGYIGKARDCVDCRLRGTSTKPSFW